MIVQRIEGTKAERFQGVLSRPFVALGEAAHHRAKAEGKRRIAIHLQRSVESAKRGFVVMRHVRVNERPYAQSLRIVGAEIERDASMLEGAGLILWMKAAAKKPLFMRPRCVGMGGSVFRIEPQRLIKQAQRLVSGRGPVRISVWQSLQEEIVGIESVGPLAARSLDLGAPYRWLYRTNNALSELVL